MKKSQIIVTSLLSAALLGGAASYLTDTCIGLFSFETMARRTQYLRGRDSTAPFETKTMRVGTFNRIDVSAGIEVIYTQGAPTSCPSLKSMKAEGNSRLL